MTAKTITQTDIFLSTFLYHQFLKNEGVTPDNHIYLSSYIHLFYVLLIFLLHYHAYPPIFHVVFSHHISPGSLDFLPRSSQQLLSCSLAPVTIHL